MKTELILCTRCGQRRSLDDFYRLASGQIQRPCAPCKRAYQREYAARNRERVLAQQVEWQRRNPERMRERRARWAASNPQEDAMSKYRYKVRKRAEKHGTPVLRYEAEQKAGRFQVWLNRCWICGSPDDLTADHVKPLCVGGPDMLANIRPACRRCNSLKAGTWPFTPEDHWSEDD